MKSSNKDIKTQLYVISPEFKGEGQAGDICLGDAIL